MDIRNLNLDKNSSSQLISNFVPAEVLNKLKKICSSPVKIDLAGGSSTSCPHLDVLHEVILRQLKKSFLGQPNDGLFVCVELAESPTYHVDDTEYTLIIGISNGFTEYFPADVAYGSVESNRKYPLNCIEVELSDDSLEKVTAKDGSALLIAGNRSISNKTPIVHSLPYLSSEFCNGGYGSALIYTW